MRHRGIKAVVLACVLGGCATRQADTTGDPFADAKNRVLTPTRRIAALNKAPAADPDAARVLLAGIAWDPAEDYPVRAAAVRRLLADPESEPAARAKALEVLPTEGSREVVMTICETAAARGWEEFVPAIVRSYSRPVKLVPERERSEREALARLRPGQSPERIAFEVFANPPAGPGAVKTRAEAWRTLARIDPSGEVRRAELSKLPDNPGDPALAELQACRRELHAMPRGPLELDWLHALRDPAKPANAAWWSQAAAAIAGAPAATDLDLRHAEVIRWAATNHTEWLSAPRDELVAQLGARLKGRRHWERSADPDHAKDRFEQVQRRLSWADALTALVIDELLARSDLRAALLAQAAADRADATTEYGGLLSAHTATPSAVSYPPRPGERQGDDKFIASYDLINASDLAIAHYHFHVQSWRNQDYAGPSPADLEYAARYGRTCVVLTGIREGVLAADIYTPDGLVLDLGEISGR